jgi:uncharacterized protein YlbG (UPF0298 family)
MEQPLNKGVIEMIRDRIGIAVWMYSLKNIKILRKFGNVHYISKKMKYAVLYCDTTKLDETVGKLKVMPFVKNVQPSCKPYISTEFNSRPDKAKEYDYKIGL